MLKSAMEKVFGASWETSVGMIFAVIGMIPSAINSLELSEIPVWIRGVGYVCSFIFFVYTGVLAKSINVTGTKTEARRNESFEDEEGCQ